MQQYKHFYIRNVGPGLVKAFNMKTGKAASPAYTNIEALIYFLDKDTEAELNENIEKMLGVEDGQEYSD